MTAVEQLELSLLGLISFDSEELRTKYKERVAKAKEMEKQQIIDAVLYGFMEDAEAFDWKGDKYNSEQYYNETFKNK